MQKAKLDTAKDKQEQKAGVSVGVDEWGLVHSATAAANFSATAAASGHSEEEFVQLIEERDATQQKMESLVAANAKLQGEIAKLRQLSLEEQ